jgi:hypothetical protein
MTLNHTIVLDPETERFESRNPFGRFELLPEKITGLARTGSTSSSISIAWNADPIAETYNVYVNGTGSPYMTGVTGTSTTITGLSSDSSYQVRVSGVNAAGEGPLSDPVTMTTGAASTGEGDLSVLKAFPTAEGGGAAASIRQSGLQVIRVTNLNDSGSGSLRAALTASPPRIVTFTVTGRIQLLTPIQIWNPYLYVAGQTAPGSGVQVSGKAITGNNQMIQIRTHDVIFRHLKFRYGLTTEASESSLFGVASSPGPCSDVIIDHCSFAWGNNNHTGAWSNSGTPAWHNMTWSNNILAESILNPARVALNLGSRLSQAEKPLTVDVDVIKNLFVSNNHRCPLYKMYRGRIINNIIYNNRYRWSQLTSGVTCDIIGNRWKSGPDSGSINSIGNIHAQEFTGDSSQIDGDASLYIEGNIGTADATSLEDDNWALTRLVGAENGSPVGPYPIKYRRFTPLTHPVVPIEVLTVTDLDTALLPHVGDAHRLDENGDWIARRDSVDTRLVSEYSAGTGALIIDETDVGGFPTYAAATAYTDSNADGVPDAWSTAAGISPSAAGSGLAYHSSGYTYIELFLGGVKP